MQDKRDVAAPPMSFSDGRVGHSRGGLRPLSAVGDGVRHGSIYWLYGASPDPLHTSEVSDPPCSGWSTVFVLDETEKTVRLYNPWVMQSWVISRGSYEFLSLQGTHEGFTPSKRAFFLDVMPRYWAAAKIRGWESSDFATAERVMAAVGCSPPEEADWRKLAGAAVQKAKPSATSTTAAAAGKPPAPTSEGLKKPVKRSGRKGEVLAFFLKKDSINEAMTQFGVTRSNLLSQLFLLRKDHGIGYLVSGDVARIELPAGVDDPFEKETV